MLEAYLQRVVVRDPDVLEPEVGIPITRFPCVLGRGLKADRRLDDPRVSRRHCLFTACGEEVWVEDLKSLNGTFLNGERLAGPKPLRDGDLIGLGPLALQVRLPRTPNAPAVNVRAVPRADRPEGHPLRILVVEDNPEAASALADVLRDWGHEVDVAADGTDALAAAAARPPEVAFLDIRLPGEDGFAVAQCLRDLPGPKVVVAMTGYEMDENARTQDGVFDHFLEKPVDPEEIRRVLDPSP